LLFTLVSDLRKEKQLLTIVYQDVFSYDENLV